MAALSTFAFDLRLSLQCFMSVKSVDKSVGAKDANLAAFETLWGDDWRQGVRQLLKERKADGRLPFSPGGKKSPLCWGVADDALCSRLQTLHNPTGKKQIDWNEAAEAWLAQIGGGAETESALEAIAWARALLPAAKLLREDVWKNVLAKLIELTQDASALQLDDDPLAFLLYAGELPFTLGALWSPAAPAKRLLKQGREALNQGANDLLDGNGLPAWSELPALRMLFAIWTRCQLMGAQAPGGCLKDKAEIQFDWLIRQSIRMTDGNGRNVLSEDAGGDWNKRLFTAAMEFATADDAALAEMAFRGSKWKKGKTRRKVASASDHSEWSRLGVLRSDWTRDAIGLAVSYGDQAALTTELFSRRQTIWSGPSPTLAKANGKTLKPVERWEEVCWFDDKDASYLELQQSLEKGWKRQRQFLISRKDGFLYTADALVGDASADLEISNEWPLHSEIEFLAAEENNEAFLNTDRREAIVLPLAMPEWRAARSSGEFKCEGGVLKNQLRGTGSALYLPMFVDLNAKRVLKPFTWRQLTVAQKLEIVPHDRAVGYRARVADTQWLFYRSLAQRANRTVMGHNLATEFYVGRINKLGMCDDIVQIE